MNFSLNIHSVTDIIIGPVKENPSPSHTYATRNIEIKTKEGDFEITLFSVYMEVDEDTPLLEVKI